VDDAVRAALATDVVVDITTTGRRSGRPRRIEIWMIEVGGRWFITGTPGRRGWLANLRAEPRLTVHLKQSVAADLAARAEEVVDEPTRRDVLTHAAATWYRSQAPLDVLVGESPMVEVVFAES
jgi:deazaflavin-dependent oxidoreductase (nitroreductase family)